MSETLTQSWRDGAAKALERQYAALLDPNPVGRQPNNSTRSRRSHVMTNSSGKTAVVGRKPRVGARYRGAFADAGAQVVAVARGGAALAELSDRPRRTFAAEVADAADPTAAWNG